MVPVVVLLRIGGNPMLLFCLGKPLARVSRQTHSMPFGISLAGQCSLAYRLACHPKYLLLVPVPNCVGRCGSPARWWQGRCSFR
jgi:hypothetical protein